MAWVRTDGRRIVDYPALLKQGETDIALSTPTSIAVRLIKERANAWA